MKCSKRKLIGTLTLLVLVIAGIAWAIHRARLARQQADFLASLASSGGSIVMDYEANGRPAPRMPLWLRGIAGDWPYAHVVKVEPSDPDQLRIVGEFAQLRELDCSSFSSSPTDELKYLQGCKHLRVLKFFQGGNFELEHAREFPELQVLDLSGVGIDSNSLACFKQLPQLRTLRLADTFIDDKGLRRLRFLKQLEELDLHDNSIEGRGLTALREMKRLRKLDLHGNPFRGTDLANLKDLALLEELDLSKTQVDDEGMAVLAGLKNLKRLDLTGSEVRGPGLRKLYGLKQLSLRMTLDGKDLEDIDGAIPIVALEIPFGAFTDNGLDHLTMYPMLEELNLVWSTIDDEGLKHLAELTGLKKLDLSHTRITDAGLKHLRGLTQLQELSLGFKAIRGSGLEVLKKTQLHELSLGFNAIRGPGLEVLKNLPRLEVLSLGDLPLRDRGFEAPGRPDAASRTRPQRRHVDRRGARSSHRPEATAKDRHLGFRHHAARRAEAPRALPGVEFNGEE